MIPRDRWHKITVVTTSKPDQFETWVMHSHAVPNSWYPHHTLRYSVQYLAPCLRPSSLSAHQFDTEEINVSNTSRTTAKEGKSINRPIIPLPLQWVPHDHDFRDLDRLSNGSTPHPLSKMGCMRHWLKGGQFPLQNCSTQVSLPGNHLSKSIDGSQKYKAKEVNSNEVLGVKG